MTRTPPPGASEDDLHAYVDGQLPPQRRAEIELWLAENPQAAAEIAGWQRQAGLIRAIFAAETPRPGDVQRLAALAAGAGHVHSPRGGQAGGKRRWTRRAVTAAAAAGLALFALGAGAGMVGAQFLDRQTTRVAALQALPEAARANYLIYAREVRHPVEVGADQQTHLVAWLSKRLGSDIAAPDLTSEGFSLVGGRLIPYRQAPAALLMYENEKGERVTILFGRNERNTGTGFRFDSAGSVQTFYWIDGPVGYAISGEIDRARLQRISEICYRQL